MSAVPLARVPGCSRPSEPHVVVVEWLDPLTPEDKPRPTGRFALPSIPVVFGVTFAGRGGFFADEGCFSRQV